MLIRKISAEDINQIINIHKRTFTKDHFTACFSYSLLKEYLSELLIANDFNYAAFDNGKMLGFLIAGFKSEQVLRNFIKNNFFKISYHLILNPRFLFEKVIEIVRKLLNIKSKSSENLRLYLIEVDSEFQGIGVGKNLLSYFEEILIAKKIFSYGLSVRKKNFQAINFYEKNNFLREFTNPKSIFFIKKLDSN